MQDNYLGTIIDFASPAGEPALLAPDSVQWRVYKNPIALGVGGIAAVLLEFAEPRIRSGVWDHSTYKADPIGRSRRTGLVAMLACYGPASVAKDVIGKVNRMHGKVKGETPAGEKYRALDPVLLDWVAATASYGFLMAYDRFVHRLADADKDRFMRDSEVIGREFGARHTPASVDGFMAMMADLEPRFEPHPILFEFLDIIQSGRAAPGVPRFLHRAIARASVSLLPAHIRRKLELGPQYDLTRLDLMLLRAAGRLADRRVDRASPPCRASVRLGLPHDFLFRSQAAQKEILALRGKRPAAVGTLGSILP
ncbi:oxygenase MpaB family protein [Sphingopyxis macrogoltabida]|uniref:Histidine kinase n=1 Tax=Sphingopyxis macrogoltabida TaxID=33050 RepID=A0AAC8YZ42_SPHMC|nr:oxygenase MpaB family protein [Sphingopyxis macrogoltabida]ALJ13606.1 histidine kinase [Sphingopyxis macrogoltabida]AMU88950.1 histidine kinase [Sphingopyxis macrogoltabida]